MTAEATSAAPALDKRAWSEQEIIVSLAGAAAVKRAGFWPTATHGKARSIHESGHLVTAYHFGRHLWGVSIAGDATWRVGRNGSSGGYALTGPKPPIPREAIPSEDRRSDTDRHRAVKLAWGLCFISPAGDTSWRAVRSVVRKLRARAEEVIEAHWPLVLHVSDALVREEELDEAQLAELLRWPAKQDAVATATAAALGFPAGAPFPEAAATGGEGVGNGNCRAG